MTALASGAWTVPGYREVRELGRGATGVVVLGEHEDSGAAVAIKHLSPELFDDPGFRADFRAEAETLVAVADPHVVRLWEYLEGAAGAAIVMDLVDGVELKEMLAQHGPTSPESALVALSGSLRGLAAAHDRGVVHRDYKPANVLIGRDGRSRLTDFGIAGRAGQDMVTAGTPLYMAPEQWSDGVATVRSDLYAATASFVECLTGRPPYPSGDPEMLRRQHAFAPIPVADVPPPVHGLVVRGMAKDPSLRPSDAGEFLAELQATASTAYGPDWEERGRRGLAERAALLAFLFPLAAAPIGATALAATSLGTPTPAAGVRTTGRRLGPVGKVLVGAAAVALIGGGVLAATRGAVPMIGITTTSSSTTVGGAQPGVPGLPAAPGAGLPAAPGAGGAVAPGAAAPVGAAGSGTAASTGTAAGTGTTPGTGTAAGVGTAPGKGAPPPGGNGTGATPAGTAAAATPAPVMTPAPTPAPQPAPTPAPKPAPAPPPPASGGGGGNPDDLIIYGGCACGSTDTGPK